MNRQRDYGFEAQAIAEVRVEELLASDRCDCVTCIVREALDAAWPALRAAALAGVE